MQGPQELLCSISQRDDDALMQDAGNNALHSKKGDQ